VSQTFLISRIIKRDITTNVRRYSCKVPLFLSDVNGTWIFSTVFEKYSIIKFNEISSSAVGGGGITEVGANMYERWKGALLLS
jgi:hypothetical protein